MNFIKISKFSTFHRKNLKKVGENIKKILRKYQKNSEGLSKNTEEISRNTEEKLGKYFFFIIIY